MSNIVKDARYYVKIEYTDPSIVEQYTTVGMFPSEKILVERFFQPGDSVLEIGCGAGRFAIDMAQRGYDVIAIDLFPEMIEAAKKQAKKLKVKVSFMTMDAVEMSFPSESFQNILFSFNTFDQISGKKNREKVLKDIFSILKPGGHLILSTRSGLAFGRRTIGWIWIVASFLVQKLNIFKKTNWEFGDKVWRGVYNRYTNPFQVKKLVRRVGFREILFNSEKNIVSNRTANILTNFSNDRSLYYVYQKQ